jgi:phage regulator Rha-like protein
MTQTEKFEKFIAALVRQYEAMEDKECTTAQTLKAVIDFANGINEIK